MDWSLLRPHAKYPLLRSDILYTNAVPVSPVIPIGSIVKR